MKKLYIGALAGVAAISLVACSDSATPVDGTKDKSDLTLEEVFNKAMDRQENIDSLKAKMDMDQTTAMTVDGQEINMTSTTTSNMNITNNPMAFYLDGVMNMSMAEEMDALEVPLKMYFTEEDGFYMHDVMSDGWLKLPNETYEEMLAQAGASADASEQLNQMKPFLKDFKFEQNDRSYLLTLNAKDDKFKDLIMGQIEGSLSQSLGEDSASLFEEIKFDKAKFIITVDKKTFDTTKVVTDFTMHMNIEGTDATVNTVSTIVYSDFNNAGTITIPKDVIENAIESEF